MNKVMLFSFLLFMLVSCHSKQQENGVSDESINVNHSSGDETEIKMQVGVTEQDSINAFLDNPLRDINNFNIRTGNKYIDSLTVYFLHSSKVKSSIERDICGGDCCFSVNTASDGNKKLTYHFFKSDCGEYGFSNDQYILLNDSLIFTRSYLVGIEQYSSDSGSTEWSIEEKLYSFGNTAELLKERKKIIRHMDFTQFPLRNLPFTVKNGDRHTIRNEKIKELKARLYTPAEPIEND